MSYFDPRDHISDQGADELRGLLNMEPDFNPGAGLFVHQNPKYNKARQQHEIKLTKVAYQGDVLNPLFQSRNGAPRQLLFKSKTPAERREEIKEQVAAEKINPTAF